MTNEQYILGQGIIFPFVINTDGRIVSSEPVDLIKASIRTILAWPLRQRFFLPEFGSRLDELLEEPNDAVLYSLARQFIIECITKWEKRINLLDCTLVIKNNGLIDINMTYIIKAINKTDTFIIPFYTKIQS
jgi:hypothetical protein